MMLDKQPYGKGYEQKKIPQKSHTYLKNYANFIGFHLGSDQEF